MKNSLRPSDTATSPQPGPPRSPARPVRRGQFWPGENFSTGTRQWDLTGGFLDHAFVLPAWPGNSGVTSH